MKIFEFSLGKFIAAFIASSLIVGLGWLTLLNLCAYRGGWLGDCSLPGQILGVIFYWPFYVTIDLFGGKDLFVQSTALPVFYLVYFFLMLIYYYLLVSIISYLFQKKKI